MDLNIDLKGFFKRIKNEVLEKQEKQKNDPQFVENESHWIKCPSCEALMFFKEVENLNHVCPKCNHHMRIGAKKRIALLADENSFEEYDSDLHPTDPLQFVDSKSYQKRLEESLHKTGKTSAIVSGSCTIDGVPVELVVFDFSFMGGSLGSVEGEKIVRACNRALEKNHGVIIISASGGARMQESTFALMQMAKTSAAYFSWNLITALLVKAPKLEISLPIEPLSSVDTLVSGLLFRRFCKYLISYLHIPLAKS